MATTSDTGAGQRGRFWLQGGPEGETVPGRLFLSPGASPLLELDGTLTPPIRETSREKLPDGGEVRISSPVPAEEPAGQSLTVHGTIDETGEPVTLLSAFAAGRAGTAVQRLQASCALAGGHVDSADPLFTRVRVRIRHLDAWANLPGFTLTPGPAAGKLTLAFEKPEVAPVPLASGARLSLDQVTGWNGPNACGGSLERRLWVDVADLPPVSCRGIERTIVRPLTNLLALSVGTECPVVAAMVSAGPDHPWLTVHHAAMRPAAEAVIPLPRILLPLAEIGLQGAAAWLDSAVRLGPLPSVVARAATSPDSTLETQFLELTAAAEALHRLILPQSERMTDEQAKEARRTALDALAGFPVNVREAARSGLQHLTDQSYPTRLLDLAAHVGQAVPGVTGNTPDWKNRVVAMRINFAHALEHGFPREGPAEESTAVLLSLRWLLTGLFLLQTGIDPDALGRRLDSHEPYQIFLAQARTWLPAVYDTRETSAEQDHSHP